MVYADLRAFVNALSEAGELVDVGGVLSPRYEIAAALRCLDDSDGRAALFQGVEGYTVPVVGNLYASKRRVAMALGIDGDLIEGYSAKMRNPIKPKVVSEGPVKEVILSHDIDILKTIPVLTYHEKDASPYFTSAVTMSKDPETGLRGIRLQRVQVRDRDKISLFVSSPPFVNWLKSVEEKGQPLDIAVVVGLDPGMFFAAPARFQPGVDQFDIAGGLRGEAVELIKCESSDVEVPANAEFVLEGQILPGVREYDGPFGESTGYYIAAQNPVAKINVITHRKQPIYHALLPFSSEDTIVVNLVYGGEYLQKLRAKVPFIRRIRLSGGAAAHLFVQVEKTAADDGRRVVDVVFETIPRIKGVIVVDADVDVDSFREVEWAVATRFQPDKHLVIGTKVPGHPLDPSIEGELTSRWGMDATKPLDQAERFEKVAVPQAAYLKARQLGGSG